MNVERNGIWVESYYKGKSVAVTGGASFIGSHLVDRLQDFGANVKVVDDLSSGKRENLRSDTELIVGDLRDVNLAKSTLSESEVVFHLAAVHGGRGFIETKQRAMLANMAIDNNVFSSAIEAQMIVHASSACAYPTHLQASESSRGLLVESSVDLETPEGTFPDGVYGWTKLMGEMQLETTVKGTGRYGRSARIFTAYGERENESHAVIALIAKAILKMEPFSIWGSGNQTRNFTYVADTVHGLLLLGSDMRNEEFKAFNIGTSEHKTVNDLVAEIFQILEWEPNEIHRDLSKPTGVGSRASDNSQLMEKFLWEPKVSTYEGLEKTIEWYTSMRSRPHTLDELELLLMSR